YTELSTWDLSASPVSPAPMAPSPGLVTSLRYSPDGSLLALGCWHGPTYREIVIRDANTGDIRGRLPMPEVFEAMAFDPSGERLACGDLAGNVVVWDLATRRPLQRFMTGSKVS